MSSKFRIGILGIGGVGGYLAFKLVSQYKTSNEVEVVLIARERTKNIIKEKGLKLIAPETEETIFPDNIVSEVDSLGKLDLIIVCVKSYDIEESISLLKPGIVKSTIILPFLNGVDITERIQKLLPDTQVLKGCVYIVARSIEPGVIKLFSDIIHFYLGGNIETDRLQQLNKYFTVAGINSEVSSDIENTIWEKYIFISPFATLTSYLDMPIGEILNNTVHKNMMLQLISEVYKVAEKKGIPLDESIVNITYEKMQRVPYETTTSMHSDFKKAHKAELDSLCGFVVLKGKELNVETPLYDKIYTALFIKSEQTKC